MDCTKIGVIHLNQIGDLLFSLPLLKALKDRYPHASIHSILKQNLTDLLSDSPYVDTILERGKTLSNTLELLQTIRKNRYDLLISLSRSEECLLLTALSKAKVKAGFAHFPLDLFLDIKETVEGHNSWFNNRKLLKQLQVNVTKNDYVGLFNIRSDQSGGLPYENRYVVISPGASRRRHMKTWNNTNFARLILLLHKHFELRPVLIGGRDNHQDNQEIIEIVKADGKITDIDNITEASLRSIAQVIQQAHLFVGIDSGFMHIASSFDLPVVGLFGPTDPFYVGPQNKRSMVVREESMECVPCYLQNCEHKNCMVNLSVERVFQACEKLMTQGKN